LALANEFDLDLTGIPSKDRSKTDQFFTL